jgi:hypothetical protein
MSSYKLASHLVLFEIACVFVRLDGVVTFAGSEHLQSNVLLIISFLFKSWDIFNI